MSTGRETSKHIVFDHQSKWRLSGDEKWKWIFYTNDWQMAGRCWCFFHRCLLCNL